MPFPMNRPALADLPQIPAQEIAALPADMLAVLQLETDESFKHIKAIRARLDGALALKYSDQAAEARRLAGKDSGTVRFIDGDFTVVADLPKRVDWDQDRLAAMVARIRAANDDPAQYVDITIKVPERKYTAWPDAIRAGFEPARTVGSGRPSFQLEPMRTP